jgi:hypothetical protein
MSWDVLIAALHYKESPSRCIAGTGVVPSHKKCTSIVPKLELEFAQFDALEAETGGRLVAWNLLFSTRPAASSGRFLLHLLRRFEDGHDG